MDQRDAGIIGTGINALVAGAMLARRGWAVTLCERNPHPGWGDLDLD